MNDDVLLTAGWFAGVTLAVMAGWLIGVWCHWVVWMDPDKGT
jgi:hypothetical protein